MPASRRSLTIDDLWSLKRIGAGAVSPDGAWACATVTSHDLKRNESSTQLWLLSTDGATQRQLTRGNRDGDPQWSPDGKWIAFVSKRGEGKEVNAQGQLYLIAADGGEAWRVGNCATGVSALRWFPDSRRLAFVSWVWPGLDGAAAQARRLKAEQDDKVQAIVVEQNHYRHWDHWFARGRRPHVHVIDIRSGKARNLFARTRFHLPLQDPDAAMFDISPDGTELAFSFDFNPDPGALSLTDVAAMDIGSGTWRKLTPRSAQTGQFAFDAPRYSPDGRWIALMVFDFRHRRHEQARVWLLERKAKRLRDWSGQWDCGVNGPVLWGADSTAIYFTAETHAAQTVWRLELDQSQPVELRRGPGHGGSATDLRISADGSTLVYSRSSLCHPPTLLACATDGSGERAIEHLNRKLLAGIALGQVRSEQLRGFGGENVQLWVVTPPGIKPGASKRHPLLQLIHGGPHSSWADAWQWRWNMQLFAAAGYVVAGVNYHGSSGWGQQFMSSIHGDIGRRELADLEAGTDHLLASGDIDPARMVAAGGSYGGYLVAYMNGKLPKGRYQAHVCHAGGYDRVSMMASDGYLWAGDMLGAFHWVDEDRVLRQSPHHFAQHFHTPTLVTHGELDYRVPYTQGLAYYNTLRARAVPARLLFFPDENHWISKPQNSRLWYREVIAWCDRHASAKAAQ